MSSDAPATARKRLDSWKEIAEYLGRDVRTAMRWEQELGLPVHRVPGGQRRGVFALPDEIDAWLAARGRQLPVEEDLNSVVQAHEGKSRRVLLIAMGAVVLIGCLALGLWLAVRKSSVRGNSDLAFTLPDVTFRFNVAQTIVLQGTNGLLATADLNHDGWVDMVIGGMPRERLGILINRGGTFEQPVFLGGCTSSGPTIGDFDGDDNQDIALACHDAKHAEVWWGDGKGNFSGPLSLPTDNEPIRCAAADLNADGIADFVADATGGRNATVFLGQRDRTFVSKQWEAGPYPTAPVIADLDGDGKVDVAFACYSAACRNVTTLRGAGDGTLQPMGVFPAASVVWFVQVADYTGDRIPDIYAGSVNGEPSFFVGIGKGKFLPAKALPRAAAAGPEMSATFTEKGRNYILGLQLYPAQYRLMEFDPEGNVLSSNLVSAANELRTAVNADFNHDGLDDLAVVSSRGNDTFLTIYLQK